MRRIFFFILYQIKGKFVEFETRNLKTIDNIKTPPKTSITQRLRTDLGR